MRASFDIAALAREMGGKGAQLCGPLGRCGYRTLRTDAAPTSAFGYKSRARTEPTAATLPQWSAAFWAKLEMLMEDIAGCCIKVRDTRIRCFTDVFRPHRFIR